MLWIPLTLLLAAFGLAEVLRQLGRPATGRLGLLIGLVFAVSAVGLVVVLVGELDIDTAERAMGWASARVESQPGLVTAALAGAGFTLTFGGAARLVDQVALADPDAPLPDTAGPGLVCGLGVVLLLASYLRL